MNNFLHDTIIVFDRAHPGSELIKIRQIVVILVDDVGSSLGQQPLNLFCVIAEVVPRHLLMDQSPLVYLGLENNAILCGQFSDTESCIIQGVSKKVCTLGKPKL